MDDELLFQVIADAIAEWRSKHTHLPDDDQLTRIIVDAVRGVYGDLPTDADIQALRSRLK